MTKNKVSKAQFTEIKKLMQDYLATITNDEDVEIYNSWHNISEIVFEKFTDYLVNK